MGLRENRQIRVGLRRHLDMPQHELLNAATPSQEIARRRIPGVQDNDRNEWIVWD